MATAPEPTPETLAMGEGRGWALVAASAESSRMGKLRGARGPRAVLHGHGIRRTSPKSAAAGGAARSCVKSERWDARGMDAWGMRWIRQPPEPRGGRRRGEGRQRGGSEEGDEAMGGGSLGEMRGIQDSVSDSTLSPYHSF